MAADPTLLPTCVPQLEIYLLAFHGCQPERHLPWEQWGSNVCEPLNPISPANMPPHRPLAEAFRWRRHFSKSDHPMAQLVGSQHLPKTSHITTLLR
jgi:hypothetical protein